MTDTNFVFIPEKLIKGLPTHYQPDGGLPFMAKERCEELAREMTVLERLLGYLRETALPTLQDGLAMGKERVTLTWHNCAKRVPCSADVVSYVQQAMARMELYIKGIRAILATAEPWQPKLN